MIFLQLEIVENSSQCGSGALCPFTQNYFHHLSSAARESWSWVSHGTTRNAIHFATAENWGGRLRWIKNRITKNLYEWNITLTSQKVISSKCKMSARYDRLNIFCRRETWVWRWGGSHGLWPQTKRNILLPKKSTPLTCLFKTSILSKTAFHTWSSAVAWFAFG